MANIDSKASTSEELVQQTIMDDDSNAWVSSITHDQADDSGILTRAEKQSCSGCLSYKELSGSKA